MPAQINIATDTPARLGYVMPAEWEPHTATWLGWPHNASDWPGKFEVIPWIYGEDDSPKFPPGKTSASSSGTSKDKAVRTPRISSPARLGVDLRKIKFVIHPTNRGWTRDTGPIFVKRENETAIVHFHFNGWAKYNNWRKDTKVPETAAKLLGKNLFHAEFDGKPFVIEGGGIEVNGRGTLLSTEECYLDPKIQVRNPGLGKKEIEVALKNYVGVKNIFWLAKGPKGDDTHGPHRRHLPVRERPDTLSSCANGIRARRKLQAACGKLVGRIKDLRLEDGRKPEVVELPMPSPLFFDGVRLPASYANFYICNAAVIVPTFNDPSDRVALGILGELFRDRPVVGIHAVDLVWGFGSLHCLTQQQPV